MIISGPDDATGTVGGIIEFACEVNFGPIPELIWEFNGRVIYYFSDGRHDYPLGEIKYLVTNTGDNFTLLVRDLDYSDGGKYICSLSTSNAIAVLIVLGE